MVSFTGINDGPINGFNAGIDAFVGVSGGFAKIEIIGPLNRGQQDSEE
jgi:hypothetical protein